MSNAVALGLILRVAQIQNVHLPSIENIILLGERVPSDVIKNIIKQFENVQKIMVCPKFQQIARKKYVNK